MIWVICIHLEVCYNGVIYSRAAYTTRHWHETRLCPVERCNQRGYRA